jgi:hypothetical protein
MKNSTRVVVAGGLLSAVLLGLHALYFANLVVAAADVLVLIAIVSGWAYLLKQANGGKDMASRSEGASGTGRFIRESNAFHVQLGNEISEQLTSANTELGNTQVILSDAITKLVSNFIVISDEVRNLSGNTNKFSAQMHALVDDVGNSLRLAERFIDGLASKDVKVVNESKQHIQDMIASITAFNQTVAQNAVELNLISSNVEQNVLVVISTLQFQDMSSQLIEHARMRMKALQEVANEMGKQGDRPNYLEYLERIAAYNRLLDKHVVSLDRQKTNPVAQKDYSSGDIELF